MCQEDCPGGSWPHSLVRIFAVDTGQSGQSRSKTVLLLTEGGRGNNAWEAGFGAV